MGDILRYKGYTTRVEYCAEDEILYGKIEGISDLVNFYADTPREVEKNFHEAVDDYLDFCRETGKEPDREYRGAFNVRVSPQLHREISFKAFEQGISLNQLVENALLEYMAKKSVEGLREHGAIVEETYPAVAITNTLQAFTRVGVSNKTQGPYLSVVGGAQHGD